MFSKFMRFVTVVALGSVMVACTDPTVLDEGFGMNQNGSAGSGDFDPMIGDTPLIGETGGLGQVPPMVDNTFEPLPDEMQTLPIVYFSNAQYVIGATASQKLDQVVEYMISQPQYALSIQGHCSVTGSAEYNRSLSEKRALVAQEYLINKGVKAGRVNTVAYGKERLAVQGNTEAAHAKNRRDVFIIGVQK